VTLRGAALSTLLALAAGCHTPSLQEASDAAAARWRLATCLPELPRVITTWGPENLTCGNPPSVAWGCHWAGRVVVSRSVPERYVSIVLAHEYGHEVDLTPTTDVVAEHVPAGHGLMAYSISASTSRITAPDLKLVCRKRNCRCQRPEK
jgi:hypothetical protein